MTTKYRINILLTLLFYVGFMASARDNIQMSVDVVYKLKAGKNGNIESVKTIQTEKYTAREYDEYVTTYIGYGENVSLDKASAPGGKARYEQNISDGIFYEEGRVCAMNLQVKKGKDANVVFERTFKDPAQFCDVSFYPFGYDVTTYVISIEVPQSLEGRIKLTPVNMPENCEIEHKSTKDGVIYRYTIRDWPKYKSQALSPSLSLTAPSVLVTGYFDGVSELYRYLHGYVDDETPSEDVSLLAEKVTNGATTAIDSIYAIADWVRQNIRYIAIEHGDYGKRPDSADKVLLNAYGDCKGSANLIKQMLKSEGYDARLVWVGSSSHTPYTWEEYPAMAAGNHMIAACVLPDTILYLDGTVGRVPSGFIPVALRGQQAMIEDGNNPMLHTIPQMPAGYDCKHVQAEYTLTRDMHLKGTVQETFGGCYASGLMNAYNSVNGTRRDDMLVRLLSQEKNSLTPSDVTYDESDEKVVLSVRILDTKAVTKSADKMFLTLPLLDLIEAETVNADGRTAPVKIRERSRQTAHVTLVLPDDIELVSQLNDVVVDTPWWTGTVKYTVEGKKILVDAEVNTVALRAEPSQVKEWNKAVNTVRKALNPVIKINKL